MYKRQTQTRRKLLIVDLPSDNGPSYKTALKLSCPSADRKPEAQDFQSLDTLRPWIASHPSGLDVLCLPRTLLEGDLAAGVYPLLETLRRGWDYVLVPLGDRPGRILNVFVEEADRVFYVREEGAEPGTPMWRQLEKAVPPQRLDLLELQRESPPRRHRPGRFYIPWGPHLGRNALAAGTPFLDRRHDVSLRGVDRLARHLGGLRIGIALGSGAALVGREQRAGAACGCAAAPPPRGHKPPPPPATSGFRNGCKAGGSGRPRSRGEPHHDRVNVAA